MVVTPGATAYLLTEPFPAADRDQRRDRGTDELRRRLCELLPRRRNRGIIIVLQTAIFLFAFVFAPKHGLLAARRRASEALETA